MAQDYPIVALLGRPNVGKSTLFNRIIGRQQAVIDDRAGTTRDRQFGEADWIGSGFVVIDTGGIEDLETVASGASDVLAVDSADFIREIRQQAELAIEEADVLVMVADVQAGVTSADEEVADILRRTSKPVIIAANKGDNLKLQKDYYDFYSLGLGEVFPITALHGRGVGDLLDAIVAALPDHIDPLENEDERPHIAILGRPNVGKSSLLNRILGEDRVIVSPVAGTTRDSIDTTIKYYDEEIVLIDTAGIRRRGRIIPGVEKYSVVRAMRAIKRADVCLLVIDATEGVTSQDAHVGGYILEENKSVVVVVNKWDLIEKGPTTYEDTIHEVREQLKFLDFVPVLFISALTGKRAQQVLPTALEVREQRFVRVPTSEVNRMVQSAITRQAPPTRAGRKLKIRYASQVAVDPPKFLFHVNDERLVHFSYQRYLENRIRDVYPFVGTPLIMEFRRSSEDRFEK